MATLFVRHEVKDFDSWKAAYDAFDTERTGLGVTGQGVYQLDGSPNQLTIYHDFENVEAAQAFLSNPRLKEVMEAAGVIGQPELWLTTQA